MRSLNYKIIFNLLLILKIIDGTPDGMVSCAWGSHENVSIILMNIGYVQNTQEFFLTIVSNLFKSQVP